MPKSSIYELYYELNEYEEISFYIGKSNNVSERLPKHLMDSISQTHTVLYSYIMSELNGWKKVKIRILHDNLPEDSDHPIVCYFERFYYDEKDKEFEMKNSLPPLLATKPVEQEDIDYYSQFTVDKDSVVNLVINSYKHQLVKNLELQNANETINRNKLLVKEKSNLNNIVKNQSQQLNGLIEDKTRNLAEIDKLSKKNDELSVKIDRFIARINSLSRPPGPDVRAARVR